MLIHNKSIFLVDDDQFFLDAGEYVLSEQFNVVPLTSGEELLVMLEDCLPDLILLDIEMPGLNGFETLTRLKTNPQTKDIPVILVSGNDGNAHVLKGFSLGASDYIHKPYNKKLLLKRIDLHMRVIEQHKKLEIQESDLNTPTKKTSRKYKKKASKRHRLEKRKVEELQNIVISTFMEIIEYRDDLENAHIGRTQDLLGVMINAALNTSFLRWQMIDWDISLILQASQLHDIGKIAINESILRKQSKLTDDEYETIKSHVTYGEAVVDKLMSKIGQDSSFLSHAKTLITAHHEKWDGSGYPHGLKGEEIPLQGRMMAIVDVYDALVSERPYKKVFSHDEAVDIIKNSSGTHFDPELVDVFLMVSEEFKMSLEDEYKLSSPPGKRVEFRIMVGGSRNISYDESTDVRMRALCPI